jgi:hypothetical protein
MAYKLDGKTLIMDRSFTHNEIQYPRNWLQNSTQEEKDAIGVTWEADPVRADDRYYWNGEIDNPKAMEDVEEVDENGNPLYVQVWNPETEAMEDTDERLVTKGLKSTKIAEVNHTAGMILANTDWYITRKVEREIDIPEKVVTHRAAIVAESNRLENAIAAVESVEALIEVMAGQVWREV